MPHFSIFILFFFFFLKSTTAALSSLCPAFLSSSTFPFSSSSECHSCFQINCSSPTTSHIFINNQSYILRNQQSNSLTLSLIHPNQTTHHCSHHFPNFSHTPFYFSRSTCSNLSHLHFCHHSCNFTLHHHLRKCPHQNQPNLTCTTNSTDQVIDFFKSEIVIHWDGNQNPYISSCKKCNPDGNVCDFNDSDQTHPFLCFKPQKPQKKIALYGTLFAFISFFLVTFIVILIFKYRSLKSKPTAEDPTALFLHRYRSAHILPPVFTFEELETSTNKFDPKRKLGDGGYGSVYLAQLDDGRIVAVKKLHRRHVAAASLTKSFCNEVLILSSIEHPNLVKLHGYCSDHRGLLLVYDYVSNGTLADHLHGSKSLYRKGSLTWQIRLEMALQTAMAIEYLHFCVTPPVVHRDITSSNIFIEKDMKIKVGDFGLSRLLVFTENSPSCVWTGPQGTPGYLDPDYHRSFRLTEKSDVYSFGVVLFELISGMKAVDLSRDKREVALADLVVGKIQMGALHQVVDPVLILEGDAMVTVDAVAELAFRCVAVDKDDRPDAKDVVAELKRIRSRTRGGRFSGAGSDAGK